jgi:hypothetical protein
MKLRYQRPQLTRDAVVEYLKPLAIDYNSHPLIIFGIRNYQNPGISKRGIYDDCIGILTANEFFQFNGNTEPSRKGLNRLHGKGLAVLNTGFWNAYRFDTHNGSHPHPAICQRRAEVKVTRDGGKVETGMFGINIHKGGIMSTSSLGCQTIYALQWDEFYSSAKEIAQRMYGNRWNDVTIPYALVEATPTNQA